MTDDDLLRDSLHEALDAHTPDRTAMLNRIAANRAAGIRPRGRFLRLAGSGLAVLTVLGLGGVAKWALADQSPSTPAAPPPATASATPSPSTVATATAPTSRSVTSHPRAEAPPATTAPTPSASLVRGHPGDTQVDKGSLSSTSAVSAAGSTVTLKAAADLTELDLTIRMPNTPGLAPDGFDSPADTVTATVTKQSDALLYHFVLRAGSTLTAGTYTFTAKYAGGARNTAGDTYEAYAFSVERKRIHIYGNFLPKE
jgi:hypothetical protein